MTSTSSLNITNMHCSQYHIKIKNLVIMNQKHFLLWQEALQVLCYTIKYTEMVQVVNGRQMQNKHVQILW